VSDNDTTMTGGIAGAVAEGRLPGRVWMYANYHCNIACAYCLTESGPKVAHRALSADTMLEVGRQAKELGFTDLGVTGGETFLKQHMPEVLAQLADLLPTVALTNVSRETISRIADKVLEEMNEWQVRPLDETYAAIFIDAIVVKVPRRSGRQPALLRRHRGHPGWGARHPRARGRDRRGGAKFWMSVLTDLKNRGVRDTFFVVCDGLKGLPEVVSNVRPQAIVQTCIIHYADVGITFLVMAGTHVADRARPTAEADSVVDASPSSAAESSASPPDSAALPR